MIIMSDTKEDKTKELVKALNFFKDDLTLDCIMSLQSAEKPPYFAWRVSNIVGDKKGMSIHTLFKKEMEDNNVKISGISSTLKIWYNLTYKKLRSIHYKNNSIIQKVTTKPIKSEERKKIVKKVCGEVEKVFSAGIFAKVMGKNVTNVLKGIRTKINTLKQRLPEESDTNLNVNEGEKLTHQFLYYQKHAK